MLALFMDRYMRFIGNNHKIYDKNDHFGANKRPHS